MEEVDYTKFLYRRPPYESGNKTPRKPKKNKSAIKKALTVITVTVLCFAIVFLCVDFFSKGKYTDYIYSLIRKTEYRYYCVAKTYPTRELAHAGALQAENGGGAAYLFSENGDYFVIFAVFCDESDAKIVSDKNKNSFIYKISYKTSSVDLADLIDGLVRDLSIALEQVDGGVYSEGALSTVRDNYIILFSSCKTKTDEEKSLVSYVLSCLKSLSPGTTDRASLLFETRHMICSVLFSAKENF